MIRYRMRRQARLQACYRLADHYRLEFERLFDEEFRALLAQRSGSAGTETVFGNSEAKEAPVPAGSETSREETAQ